MRFLGEGLSAARQDESMQKLCGDVSCPCLVAGGREPAAVWACREADAEHALHASGEGEGRCVDQRCLLLGADAESDWIAAVRSAGGDERACERPAARGA